MTMGRRIVFLMLVLMISVGVRSPCFPDQVAKGFSISKPEWYSGDSWTFQWRDAMGESGLSVRTLVGETRLDETACFVMKTTSFVQYIAKQDLNWVALEHNGRITNRASPSQWWFLWPLEPGKKWVRPVRFTMFDDTIEYNEIVEVDDEMESITVPAGTFRAIGITKGYSNSKNHVKAWYCPEIKNFIKVVHRRPNIFLEELVACHLPREKVFLQRSTP